MSLFLAFTYIVRIVSPFKIIKINVDTEEEIRYDPKNLPGSYIRTKIDSGLTKPTFTDLNEEALERRLEEFCKSAFTDDKR